MRNLSPAGEHAIDELARRHGFGRDAVMSLLQSVIRGNGTMAQFDHPEFGGSGQWMAGGMTMVSDMFDSSLKHRVANLASELAQLARSEAAPGRSQSPAQRVRGDEGRAAGQRPSRQSATASLFVPPARHESRDWWPAALRIPTSRGAQNDVRYAYFAQARRLAIELNGQLTLYDTLDHEIGGFSQEQSRGGSLSFRSQHGLVKLADLPIVS